MYHVVQFCLVHAGREAGDMAVGINERHVGSTIRVGLKEHTHTLNWGIAKQGKIEALNVC